MTYNPSKQETDVYSKTSTNPHIQSAWCNNTQQNENKHNYIQHNVYTA
jgi:hypothetical protein